MLFSLQVSKELKLPTWLAEEKAEQEDGEGHRQLKVCLTGMRD